MLPDHVITLAREKFPGAVGAELSVQAIEKGGSERKFYRVSGPGERSMIVVKYSDGREENKHYVELARFLGGVGVNVPTVYLHDPEEGLIFMEDLGETDLWSMRESGWKNLSHWYMAAIEQMVRLHAGAAQALAGQRVTLQLEFDEPLYLWEQRYFIEHCLTSVFGVPSEEAAALAGLEALRETARKLAALPRVIIHRDFQSQNVLIDRGSAWLIDFQGMRPGLPQYDLASLLYDPYVNLLPSWRDQMISAYKERALAAGLAVTSHFDEVYRLCAMQRLMQALGAYGFLGLQRGRPHFLSHIPAARASLEQILPEIPGLESLATLLQSLPNHESFQP
ncbi:MAG: hypothetical protein Fur0032_07340 [Terrimicrobiaceae bacterium]